MSTGISTIPPSHVGGCGVCETSRLSRRRFLKQSLAVWGAAGVFGKIALQCATLIASVLAGTVAQAAELSPEDAAILLPIDPPCVQQARHDLLLEIRRRYAAYSGAECGGFVDMFMHNDPVWDRKANEKIVIAVRAALHSREADVWAKGKAWDGQFYPNEQQFLEVWFRYGDRLSADARRAIEEAWREALFTDLDARRLGPKWRQGGSWYWIQLHNNVGNWGLIAAEVAILGGEIAKRPEFVAEGKKTLQEWFQNATASGMVNGECNLMEGHWRIYSFVLAPLTEWAPDPATRRLARLLLERLWLEKLVYFHSPTLRECGASGRCVVQGLGEPIVDTNQRLWLATQLNQPISYTPPPASAGLDVRNSTIHQTEPWLVSRWRVPDYLQDLAFRKTLPQVVRSTCETETTPWPNAIPSKSPLIYPDPKRDRWQFNDLYTWLTETFAFGTMSRGWADVGMPALAFWKAHTGPPRNVGDHRALYVRYQHNDRKPFGRAVEFLRGREVEPPPHANWTEGGRHAAMQDHGRAIVIYRPRLDYLKSYELVPGVPGYVTFDGDLAVSSLQALACFYREDVSPRGFFIGDKPVGAFPTTVESGQWVFVDDGETWVAVRSLEATDLGGALPARLVAGDRHVFLQSDNCRSPQPTHPDIGKLRHCRSGFLMAVGDRTEYADFAAFRAEMAASKVSESCDGDEQRVEWSAGKKTLRLGWDVFEERYLERSVNGVTQDPWPRFASAEYQQALTCARLGDATVTTRSQPQTPVWLLADCVSQIYVVYQPNPDRLAPVTLETSLGRVTTGNFPFGKLVFGKSRAASGKESLRIDADAEYPATPVADMTLEITGANLPVTAIINGLPAPVCAKDDKGRWRVSPYAEQ